MQKFVMEGGSRLAGVIQAGLSLSTLESLLSSSQRNRTQNITQVIVTLAKVLYFKELKI